MSLEAQIETLNNTIVALIGVISDTPTGAKNGPPASGAASLLTPPANNSALKTDTPALTYDDVAKVVSAFVKANGREPAVKILKTCGLEKFTEARDKPELFAPVLAAFTAAVAPGA